ncbi:uncharacterized protein LOC127744095 [Arachis duranensis]|uniref:Uncharacterized protein LOC127741243 n=1 Tax=Arachis duranensis TaxID=130453 RepID=A0A9C6T3N3_ARADU|nr:uncharacterized protein LOC127741243 [Arachis duranensis]XP_052112328.1 uncharacterized protein LOC127744095 [Arachis duranensis]
MANNNNSCVSTLSELKSLILNNLGDIEAREVRKVGYRLLAPMGNGVFRFRLFHLLGNEHVRLMFDIPRRIMAEQVMELSAEVGDIGRVDKADAGDKESDEEYAADSADSDSFEEGDDEEFVPKMPTPNVARHVLPPPYPIPALSTMPNRYHSLDLDTMHERTLFSDTGEEDYNLDGGGRVSGRPHIQMPRRRALGYEELQYLQEYRCRQATNGCPWSLHMALRQNLGYWEVRRIGGAHSSLAPTMSQDHRQLDSSLICRVILPLIQSNPSVSIPVLQGAVRASYHFKPSYRKVWMAKQKAIVQIYGDWEESFNKVPKLLQAMQSYFSGTICDLRGGSYYDRHLLVRNCSIFDKVFWTFPSCVEAFKHCKPFVYVDDTHLYGRYGGVLLIAISQDGNSNILPIAFTIVESESTESWSFFLTNLRRHVTPHDGLLVY